MRNATFVMCAALAACGGTDDEKTPEPLGPVEVLTWWGTGGDAQALNVLIDEHEARTGEQVISSMPTTDSGATAALAADATLADVKRRIDNGTPLPDVLLATGSTNMRTWTAYGDAQTNLLMPLDDFYAEHNLASAIIPEVLSLALFNGSYYQISISMHQQCVVFYNKNTLLAHGIEDPATLTTPWTLERFVEVLNLLKNDATAPMATPILANPSELWKDALFNKSPAFIDDYFKGNMTADADKALDDVLASFSTLAAFIPLDWITPGTNGGNAVFNRTVAQAVDAIKNGTTAFYATGNWDGASFRLAGFTGDTGLGMIAFPGTERTFVFNPDSFVTFNDSPNQAGALAFFETAINPEVQAKWASVKSAVPLIEVDPDDIDDPMVKSAQAAFEAATYHFTPNAFPSSWWSPLKALATQAILDGNTTALRQFLLDNYTLAGTALPH